MTRSTAIAFVVAAAIGATACGGSGGGKPSSNVDASADKPHTCATATTPGSAMNGDACSCASDCQSQFCVGGVCCNTACTGTCMACDVQGSPGICTFVPAGAVPRAANECPAAEPSSCGLDGTCDGAGACRDCLAGTICQAGSCSDGAVVGVNVCDGRGRCKPGPATICAPFDCDPTTNACVVTCHSNADCIDGVACVNGSCGPKRPGAVCSKDADCASGFCTDGVCCNIACRGACVSCNQIGRVGTCWPIDLGAADPHGICKDKGPPSCGQTGTCDGIGGCALYAAETICIAPGCSGDRLNTPGTCNGIGACRPPGIQVCAPYRCNNGSCNSRCMVDADCVSGQVCENGSCGPKPNGQPCAAASECISNFCVDGVCCAEACQGACRSCALPSSMGRCVPVPDGASDPRNICVDEGATSCGRDGKCDGASGCRSYGKGTICAGERCENNVYTPPATCNDTGNCVAPDSTPCAPFACNGTRCFMACTTDANCVAGKVCANNSCGLKLNGAFCSDKKECASGNCAQGVCCASACAGMCKSCALPTSMGVCANIPDGQPDPTATCVYSDQNTCGANGRCQAGACQNHAHGTQCKPASCPANSTTFTPAGSCDGAGTCTVPAATSCFPFSCGTGACKSTCTSDADCASPGVCSGGSCGLKTDGAMCGAGGECASGLCVQGVCCKTACTGTCMSCALTGSAGTCTPVPGGARDPAGRCPDQGAVSCGTNGFCDGAGACQKYDAGTQCAPPVCPLGANAATLARTCDGAGTCRPAATQTCAPYTCNGSTCRSSCAMDSDCVAGKVCNNGSCGNKRLGQICAAGAECDSGNCVDGVCCGSPSCGTCAACNVVGNAGTCKPVPAGAMEPHGGCAAAPPCGFNGTCDGAGACRPMTAGTSCGTASCSGSTFTPVGSCDGAGVCRQTSTSCAPYVCGTGACNTTCAVNTDCVLGYSCLGSSCTNLKANGAVCNVSTECISGFCTEGFCCGAASCGTCKSCAIAGKQGTCSPIADGTACGSATCDGQDRYRPASTCSAGTCTMSTTRIECAPYACDVVAACKTSCTSDADCAKKNTCTVPASGPGTCGP
ncbi:MAG TPA: hypothetical protein VN903_08855 [Polyangia bacterium]|nr:hypothetical protein [Polyangia bacterium]